MKIAITTDTGIAITTLVDGADPDEVIEKIKAVLPGYVSHRTMGDDEALPDRTTREAWVDTGAAVQVDEVRALAIADAASKASQT